MAAALLVPVFKPFLELAVLTYVHGRQLSLERVEAGGKFAVHSEHSGSKSGVVEQVVDHLIVHSHAAEHCKAPFLASGILIGTESGVVFRRI